MRFKMGRDQVPRWIRPAEDGLWMACNARGHKIRAESNWHTVADVLAWYRRRHHPVVLECPRRQSLTATAGHDTV